MNQIDQCRRCVTLDNVSYHILPQMCVVVVVLRWILFWLVKERSCEHVLRLRRKLRWKISDHGWWRCWSIRKKRRRRNGHFYIMRACYSRYLSSWVSAHDELVDNHLGKVRGQRRSWKKIKEQLMTYHSLLCWHKMKRRGVNCSVHNEGQKLARGCSSQI